MGGLGFVSNRGCVSHLLLLALPQPPLMGASSLKIMTFLVTLHSKLLLWASPDCQKPPPQQMGRHHMGPLTWLLSLQEHCVLENFPVPSLDPAVFSF